MQGCRIKSLLLLTLSVLLVNGCNTTPTLQPTHGLPIDQMHDVLQDGISADKKRIAKNNRPPARVRQALFPTMTTVTTVKSGPPPLIYQTSERRFNITANKTPARAFFMGLIDGTKNNIIINSNISGEVTLDLKNVTVPQVLEAVRDAYGYEFQKKSYGYEIFPQKLETRVFNVNYLNVKRSGISYVDITSGQITESVGSSSAGSGTSSGSGGGSTPATGGTTAPGSTPTGSNINTRTETNFWYDLNLTLKQMVGNKDGRSVGVNPNGGIVIVHAFPSEIRTVGRFLDRIQTNMNRQVILEAKILEVQLSDQFQSGIDWNLFGNVVPGLQGGVAQSGLQKFDNTDLKDFTSIFTLRVNGDFGGIIKLLQSQGTVQILSSPHISTVNNQKAIIKVGQDNFFVTGVSSTTGTSGGVVGGNVLPSENITLTPFFSGITLDVTPQISADGEIVLHIHPTVSKVVDQEKVIVLGSAGVSSASNTFILPLAQSTVRESDTIVRAKSGQVIVLGGLMSADVREDVAGVPYLSRLPLVGPFFRRNEQLAVKIELVILLKPIFAEDKAWINEMQKADKTLDHMNRGLHIGSLPETFGNKAENMDRFKQGLLF